MIKYSVDVLITFLIFGVFAFLHSLLASNRIKKSFANKFGDLIAFYRFAYVLFAIISFWMIYNFAPHEDLIIYDLPFPFDFLILVPQFLGLAGFLWTLKYFSSKEFLGINQIVRWRSKEYNTADLDEELYFRIEGPYKFCRHPLYFFSIIFLLFRPEMDLFYLNFLICIIAYFYIGSIYEEKKLTEKFGDEYVKYQKNTPRIFPFFFKSLKTRFVK